MKKGFVIVLATLLLLVASPSRSTAQSEYVLPYPSAMPGSTFYFLDHMVESISQYWYYGDFGAYTFNLAYADKYLVETKILFEYKQYLLGTKALKKSNMYLSKVNENVRNAKSHGKDISEKSSLFSSAKAKHIEVLLTLIDDTPEEMQWATENSEPEILQLHRLLMESIRIRK